jgi:hypothetical protein
MVPSDDRLIALLTQANPALPDEGLDLDFGVSCIDLGFEINRIGGALFQPLKACRRKRLSYRPAYRGSNLNFRPRDA